MAASADLEDLCRNNHQLSENTLPVVRQSLLDWYDKHQRGLPWRQPSGVQGTARPAAHGQHDNTKAYAIWISEVMCQQTQISTVIEYYKRWMHAWPTVADLAAATIAEVHEIWAGLGYYSRATRLLKAAQQVVNDHQGLMPTTKAGLLKLPGIGPYTASAIASIAFNERVGVVDGNVIRVLTRVQAIASEATNDKVTKLLWRTVDMLADTDRSGDINQAVMELGATVCCPKKPQCEACPLRKICQAYQTKTRRQEAAGHACAFCHGAKLQVVEYPVKKKKKASPTQHVAVAIIEAGDYVLLRKRPATGLLAGLWAFILREVDDNHDREQHQLQLQEETETLIGSLKTTFKRHGEVTHVFSHLKHVYHVFTASLRERTVVQDRDDLCWQPKADVLRKAVSTNMKKVWQLSQGTLPVKAKRTSSVAKPLSKPITKFFKPAEDTL
eukprot:m.109476 g.109476  ORF g.109476 m.109476 type:complete len:442 (-) comp15344_c0_seq2:937-2262(-)